jgi:hypothetical protein
MPSDRFDTSKAFGFNVNDDYRVTPCPRWGHGLAPHPGVQAVLERGRDAYGRILEQLEAHRSVLHQIRHDADPGRPAEPFWNNIWFTALDAAVLVGFLLARKPRHYMEIGSGHSTMFAAHAIRLGALSTIISSIDPHPRSDIEALCQRRIRAPLETCHLNLFDELETGDILFFDGTHRVFQNSDVTAFFLDVLPRLKPGILVHVHDVFLPADYPPEWTATLFSEQYMLAAMLLCAAPPFRVVFPNYFVCTDAILGARVRAILQSPNANRDIPFCYANPGATPGNSFWIETKATT